MKKFEVVATEKFRNTFVVDAETEEEARTLVENNETNFDINPQDTISLEINIESIEALDEIEEEPDEDLDDETPLVEDE